MSDLSSPTVTPDVAEPQVDVQAEHARLSAELDQVQAALRAVRSEQVPFGSPLLSRVWTLAERYARNSGVLREYNILAEELDGPTATATYEVLVDVSINTTVRVTVEATSGDDACERVEGDHVRARIEDLYGMDAADAIDDWTVDEAEEV